MAWDVSREETSPHTSVIILVCFARGYNQSLQRGKFASDTVLRIDCLQTTYPFLISFLLVRGYRRLSAAIVYTLSSIPPELLATISHEGATVRSPAEFDAYLHCDTPEDLVTEQIKHPNPPKAVDISTSKKASET